jgi:DNA-binding beta-propeller fold protein YncE
MKKAIFITGCLIFSACSFLTNAQSHYKIVNKMKLAGDAGWDYIAVDDSTNMLYVSHGTMVQVVNLNTGKLAGTIDNTNGVHGIALAPDLNKGFISDGKDSAVTIFDLKTLATIAKVNVTGRNPDAIVYDNVSQRVITFNGRSSNATVLDAKTNMVVGSIALPGKPEFAVADGKGKIYVNIEDKNEVLQIDAATMKVEQTWSLGMGEGPSGLSIDKKTRRLFSVCDNKLMVIMSADDGKIVTTIPIGEHVDAAGFDVRMNRVYSSNGDGTLTVVQEKDANTFTVLENVVTQRGARTIAVNSKTHHIYLPTAEFGSAPEATKDKPHPKPSLKLGSFIIIDVATIN